MILADCKLYDVKYCESEELEEVIFDCLIESMFPESSDCIEIPTILALGYSDDGGMALAIGQFFIICDDNPPDKQKVVEIIKEAYKTAIEDEEEFPFRVGEVIEISSKRGKEWNFEVELNCLS